MDSPNRAPLALVLSGGGARGAYEAGVLHYFRTMLPEPFRSIPFPIQSGSSVGAVNTCFLASTADDPGHQGRQIVELWKELRADHIYLRDTGTLTRFLGTSLKGIVGNFVRPGYFKNRHDGAHHFKALFDTKPFRKYLTDVIRWENIPKNVASGVLHAVSIVATRMRTGAPEIFLQKGRPYCYRGEFEVREVDLAPEHAMASAAIPLIFSSVAVGDHLYVDGSVRLNTPLSPAIQLGAHRIVIVSPHSQKSYEAPTHECTDLHCPPTLGEHLGKLFNAFFQDRLKYDVSQLRRINRLIEASEKAYGPDYLGPVNELLGPHHALFKIGFLEISPSVPIPTVFSEWFQTCRNGDRWRLSFMERLLMKFLDISPAFSLDLLSYLTFERDYLVRLMDLGFEDARRQQDRICAFLDAGLSSAAV
jgi:NTE family protein